MTVPYAPVTFATPALNPAIGGYGKPQPYISCSMYEYAPTAMNTDTLVPGGTAADQTQSLYETIGRASAWVDRYVYGTDPAAKGASLAATLSVESDYLPTVKGEVRLICDYKPVLELVGCDVGIDPSSVSSIGSTLSAKVRFGRRTIYVPVTSGYWPANTTINTSPPPPIAATWPGRIYVVWSYVNGYPHTSLAADVAAGATSLNLVATNGAGGFYGIYPGTTMTIVDGVNTEKFSVASVSGTTITTVAPLANAHTVPTAPDFLPVTALPEDVTLACIFFTTALIKTRGDNSVVLDELIEPTQMRPMVGDVESDVAYAMELLDPYRIRLKSPRNN